MPRAPAWMSEDAADIAERILRQKPLQLFPSTMIQDLSDDIYFVSLCFEGMNVGRPERGLEK